MKKFGRLHLIMTYLDIEMKTSSSSDISFNNFVVDLLEPLQYKPGFKNHFKVFFKILKFDVNICINYSIYLAYSKKC